MSSPRLLSNRYEIGDTLGYGGMSEVHRGRDIRLGRDVAVKVLRADLARDPTFQLRFRREAQNAAALNHPAIVAVYDTGETESENGPLPYIVMEYVDGRTLRDIVKSEGPLTSRRAMEVMADASAALDFSHRHGIVHRDVKPANIMITRSGAVKVMDFGIARAVADGQAAVTQTAAVIGTAQYLSPEQARGESVDARSDVYASGCVLFELLTGEPPFTGDSPVAVAYQHVREDPRKPSDVNQQVPASLDAVVLKALSKNPMNRYQSAAEMRADLVRVLSGQRPKAPMIMSEEERTSMLAPSPTSTEVMPPRRHRQEPRVDDDEYYDDGRQRKRRKSWMIALVTLLCIGVFALVAWWASGMFGGNSNAGLEPAPNFMNMRIQEARAQAGQQRWNVTSKPCPSRIDQIDLVVGQTPTPGTMVNKLQSRIELCAGAGPKQIQVPELAGKTLGEASQELDRLGLKLGPNTEQREVTDPRQVGRVIDWDNKGSSVPEGTTINVTIGKEIVQVPLPDVRNLQFEQARGILQQSKFVVNRVERESDKPAGTVIDQTPPGSEGATAKPGTVVTLTVSNGQQITVPPLTGKTPEEAQQLLQSLGWSGQISEQKQATSDASQDGKVISSSPTAGQKISKTQSIVLIVGEFDLSPPTSSQPNGGVFPPFD
jgi:eukaryotic-like serine/threonine-protein kinase